MTTSEAFNVFLDNLNSAVPEKQASQNTWRCQIFHLI